MTRAAPPQTVRLGFEVGTGEPVEIPVLHMAVTGQTQQSGKTTTLEALVGRTLGATAIAFVTKRGETNFTSARDVVPYFRDRADWQFVTSLIDATLQEKNKFLRPWIMRICRTTRTLAEVQAAVRKELKTARGIHEGVYTQLDAYLDLIVPELARTPMAPTLDLSTAELNVMDLSRFSSPMQMLFIQSALDWINTHAHQTIVIVPEAWEFIPEGKGSPVKASAVDLVRKGGAVGNYIWVDSQDMAGVDKVILRGCTVWLIGVQREANEIKRNLSNIPAGIRRPTPAAIAGLERGQFYACWKDQTVRVYVQPAWMPGPTARAIAMGEVPADGAKKWDFIVPGRPMPEHAYPPMEAAVNQAEARQLRDENEQLRERVANLERMLSEAATELDRSAETALAGRAEKSNGKRPLDPIPVTDVDTDGLYQAFKSRLIEEAPGLLRVMVSRPSIEVEFTRETIHVDGKSLRGHIARLIQEGFWASPQTSVALLEALAQRGVKPSNIELGNELKALVEMGFFTRNNKWFSLVDGMEVNVVERRR